ncbi:wound-induced protein 1 [Prosopis cineraria]|uniref:wound-induced protein 1 n=1 Tax=Prosopis cineraria TaxID=364024 RepID=UPI00240FA343|nr:wound-induced protein 1 [Prosopis cineraria]
MRMLTGEPSSDTFRFVPQSLASFGPIVIVEGCDNNRSIWWIHAWTVTDGIITQVREYFNTSLAVTRVGDSNSSPTSEITAVAARHPCPFVWESSVSQQAGKSVPGLVLAI